MAFVDSPRVVELKAKLLKFFDAHIYPTRDYEKEWSETGCAMSSNFRHIEKLTRWRAKRDCGIIFALKAARRPIQLVILLTGRNPGPRRLSPSYHCSAPIPSQKPWRSARSLHKDQWL